MRLRDLPSVDELVRGTRRPARRRGRPRGARAGPRGDPRRRDRATCAARLDEALAAARRPALRRVLNATGVIVHTNLGRAPLSEAALDRIVDGDRLLEPRVRPGDRLARLPPGPPRAAAPPPHRRRGAIVVNNNAAAILLALAALAEGREVVVSRGELIEIGDGFRIPDVLARSGARLVEVGTTNRTRAADYEGAIGPGTALLLRVHQSTSASSASPSSRGSTSSRPSRAATTCRSWTISARARWSTSRASRRPRRRGRRRRRRLLLRRQAARRAPGRHRRRPRRPVERLRRHPLHRAVRSDKLTLAGLEGTLATTWPAGRDPGRAHAARAGRGRP